MIQPVSGHGRVQSVSIIDLSNSLDAAQVFPVAGDKWQGPIGGDTIPQVAAIVTHYTVSRGPSGRGRTFLPYISELTQFAGRVGANERLPCDSGWAQFTIDIKANPITPLFFCVASYKHGTSSDVVGSITKEGTGTQRRRNKNHHP